MRKRTGKKQSGRGAKRTDLSRIGRRAGAILLTLTLCCGLAAGCGKKAASETGSGGSETEQATRSEENIRDRETRPVSTVNKEFIYRCAEEAGCAGYGEVSLLACGGEMLYFYYRDTELENGAEDIHHQYGIVRVDRQTGESGVLYTYSEIIPIMGAAVYGGDARGNVQELSADGDGNLYALACALTPEGKEDYSLICWNAEGNEQWTEKIADGDWRLRIPVCIGEKIYLPFGSELLIYSKTGTLERRLEVENVLEKQTTGFVLENINGIYPGKDGEIILSYYGDRTYLFPVDGETGKLGDLLELPLRGVEISAGGESGYDFILRDSQSVYGWNIGEDKANELFRFLDSGLDSSEVGELFAEGKELFYSICKTDTGSGAVYALTKAAPEEIEDRKRITVGVLMMNSREVKKDIARFNRSGGEYQAELVDYSAYSDPLTQFALDAANNREPDVFLVQWYTDVDVPMEAYARQGLFADLLPLLDADEELSRGQFLENVFEAFSPDGHLYYLPLGVSVLSYVGKTETVGQRSEWTMEEMRRVEEAHPDSRLLFVDRGELLRDALAIRWRQFVDEEEGTCRFDSEEFTELLEWVGEYPAKLESGSIGEMPYRSGELLLANAEFRTFAELNRNLEVMFGDEETAFIGLPGADGNGSLLRAKGMQIAISSASGSQEGAWQFVRYYLSDSYQGATLNRTEGQFPIRRSALQKLAEETVNSQITDSYYLNGREVPVQPPTREETDRWIGVIESVNCADLLDNALYNIIAEEAEAYFQGQKTAESVAEIIQGRAKIYVSEKQ